jgi:hypothetical protein
MSFKVIDELTLKVVELTESWQVQEFGNLASWFKIFYIINNLAKEHKTSTQLEKITLSLDVVENFANAFAQKYRDKLNEKEREILDIFVNGQGASVLQASNDFLQEILNNIDTNKDGKISKQECKNYFCCIPRE